MLTYSSSEPSCTSFATWWETRHDMLKMQKCLTDGHNKLASRMQEQEQNLKRVRRASANNVRLICKVGVSSGTLPESAVKEALEGVEETL